MLFNSLQYAAFLVVVLLLHWVAVPPLARALDVPPRRARLWLLLVASYLFYAAWDWRFCALLAASTGVNYWVGRRLAGTANVEKRKLLLTVAVLYGIGVLAFFKYIDFAIGSFADLLELVGIEPNAATLGLTVPWGISFFTFHTLSYAIDVYRRELEPTDDLLAFGVFVAYFPQLLAGPLTRGRRMLPQLTHLPDQPDRLRWAEGAELILLGLFQKVAVADALAPMTATLFAPQADGAGDRSWLVLCLGAMASVIQFVLDFAGYSNIARGTSKLFGVELPYNFRQPITRSRDFQDYWRRHHMTLMAWFRDYVLRPLRRRSDSRLRSSLILVFVFVLSGLWHGASWTWVVWGLYVGIAVAVEIEVKRRLDLARRRRRPAVTIAAPPSDAAGTPDPAHDAGASVAALVAPTTVRSPADIASHGTGDADVAALARRAVRRLSASIYVLSLMAVGMLLIRSSTLGDAFSYVEEIAAGAWPPLDWDVVGLFAYAVVALVVADHVEHRMERAEGTPDPPTVTRAALWGAMIALMVVFSGTGSQPFVYFQF